MREILWDMENGCRLAVQLMAVSSSQGPGFSSRHAGDGLRVAERVGQLGQLGHHHKAV